MEIVGGIPRELSIGQIVNFVLPKGAFPREGEVRPAIVVRVIGPVPCVATGNFGSRGY
jgi:hypothetical protein